MGWINWILYNLFGRIPKRMYVCGNKYQFLEIIHNESAWTHEKVLVYNCSEVYSNRVLFLSQFGFIIKITT